MNKAPCRNCSERAYLCHSDCKRYKEFKEWKDMISQKRREENDLNHAIVESIERLYSKIGRQSKRRVGNYDKYE